MLRTSVFRLLHIGTVALLVLAFTISAAGAQMVQAANSTQISAGWMPFTGSLYDSQTNSHINVNGLVHILARWKSVSANQSQIDLDVNLPAAGVSVTSDTGIPYMAYGAGQSSVLFPNNPLFPNDPLSLIVPSFWLAVIGSDRALPPNPVLPPNPIKPLRLLMQTDLVFSAAGVLDFSASAVYVDIAEDIDVGGDG